MTKHLLRLCSHRKARRELLSTSAASWATTKSVGMCVALQELREKQVIMDFQTDVKRGPRRAILDVVYVLMPDFCFVQEVKRANARAKQITEAATNLQTRIL